jgi:uncharacterized protein (TIGR00375 family)
MRFFADLHIHSKYSRATSGDMVPEGLWRWAQLKGITVMGSGDFTHPRWFKELTDKLEPVGNGLFALKQEMHPGNVPESCKDDPLFLLSVEISCIYRKKEKTRKVHSVIFAPDFESAARIGLALSKIGNIASDGRPILGLDAKELLKITLDASPDAMFVPAHIWTPHFSVLGAVSGFDSLEECFEELTPHIKAVETGLSSDPPMNWRLSALDRVTLISNSDAHSPPKIGREANIFDTEVSYKAITTAIESRKGFLGTVEFFPEEGKYHYDGHRQCGVIFSPSQTKAHQSLCPVCKKRLTVGVLYRVEELADRPDGFVPKNAIPSIHLIPLEEIIAESLNQRVGTKGVDTEYERLVERGGSEFRILLDATPDELATFVPPRILEGIIRMRQGRVSIVPGHDGVYGKISLFPDKPNKKGGEGAKDQLKLF